MIADEKFPVYADTALPLNCKEGYQLSGDKQITCTKDTEFQYSTEPQCGEVQIQIYNIKLISKI